MVFGGAKDAGIFARQQLEFTPVLHGSCLSCRSFLFGVAQKERPQQSWAAPLLVLYRIITECFFGYEIQAAATIGRRFTIHHGYAVVIK